VLEDLSWTATVVPKLEDMADARPRQWFSFLRSHAKKFVVLTRETLIKLSAVQAPPAPLSIAVVVAGLSAQADAPMVPIVLINQWACPICGKDDPSFQALAAHRARTHGVLREARSRVVHGRCFVCLRNFHTRERLIEHLHKGSPVCLLNTLPFHPRLDPDVIEAADSEQRARGKKARSRCENPSYAEHIVRQGFGPMQTLIIPVGHSRESRFFLMQEALRDPFMAIAADSVAIKSVLSSGSRSDMVDEIPLTMLPRLAVGH